MTKRTKAKTPGFKAGLIILAVFTFAMGSLGAYGWAAGQADLLTKSILVFAAAVTAAVIPFTVIALGRSWASIAVIPVLAVCMLVQAVSFHNFVDVVIEAPHNREFETRLQPFEAEVARTMGRLKVAEAALDAFVPEVVTCSPCRNTRNDAAKRDADRRAALVADVDAAKTARSAAQDTLKTEQDKYKPQIPAEVVWTIGGALDLSIALAIWGLEMTALRLRAKAKTERAKAARPKRKTTKAPAPKAPVRQTFIPRVVAGTET